MELGLHQLRGWDVQGRTGKAVPYDCLNMTALLQLSWCEGGKRGITQVFLLELLV